MICLGGPYHFRFFKDCLQQFYLANLEYLDPFNTFQAIGLFNTHKARGTG